MLSAEQHPVTAIDILLEPDAIMVSRAEAANAGLLKIFPEGFALDATHRPHVSVLQRFVRRADLGEVYAAVTEDYLNEMLAAPFDAFTFSPAGASVYQLGNYGTAMKRLHSFELPGE